MRRLRYSLLVLFLTFAITKMQAVETFMLPLPKILSKWKIGNQKEGAQHTIIYYILENETMHNWTQLVNVQFKHHTQSQNQNALAAMQQEALLNQGVMYKIHHQQENDVLFEKIFPSGLHELVRMVITEKGIHRVAYTRRDSPFAEIDRNQWLERLSKGNPIID